VSARLHLVRHGQTPSNVAGALDTALPGAPLTELGREQAQIVGAELAASGISPSVVLSSEAARARETAGLIGEQMELDSLAVPGVHEVQAGKYEMQTGTEAMVAYNRVVRDWLEEGDLSSSLPDGESALDVQDRAMPLISELRESYLDNGIDVVLVVHGVLMRMVAVFAGAVPSQWALDNWIPNCGIIELAPDGGGWSCQRWGDHLGPPTY